MYSFKLEGGEWFKEGFHKLFKREWNSLQETRFRNSVCQEQSSKQKSNRKTIGCFVETIGCLYQKYNNIEIKELKEERIAQTIYTGSLLTQELHPVSQKPLGNPLGNQIQITYTHHQRSDLDPLKTHTSFGSAHTPPRILILTTSRAHNPSWLYNTRMYTQYRTNYTVT